MRKLHLLPILLVIVLFQTSCKDSWHPEEAKYATIILEDALSGYPNYSQDGILHSVNTGKEYQFPSRGVRSLKVPAGTYYVSVLGYTNVLGDTYRFDRTRIRSENFSVEERATKIVIYFYDNGGEFRL